MVGIIHILIAVVVFHKEAKHILVSNGILDKILVKTVAEDFLCGMSVNSILDKDGSTSETEYLRVVEELHDILVTFSEMASMTFIEYHHDARMAYFLYTTTVPLPTDRGIELLYGGDDNL